MFRYGIKNWYHSDRYNVPFNKIYILKVKKFQFRNLYFIFSFNDVNVWSELTFERDAIR